MSRKTSPKSTSMLIKLAGCFLGPQITYGDDGEYSSVDSGKRPSQMHITRGPQDVDDLISRLSAKHKTTQDKVQTYEDRLAQYSRQNNCKSPNDFSSDMLAYAKELVGLRKTMNGERAQIRQLETSRDQVETAQTTVAVVETMRALTEQTKTALNGVTREDAIDIAEDNLALSEELDGINNALGESFSVSGNEMNTEEILLLDEFLPKEKDPTRPTLNMPVLDPLLLSNPFPASQSSKTNTRVSSLDTRQLVPECQ